MVEFYQLLFLIIWLIIIKLMIWSREESGHWGWLQPSLFNLIRLVNSFGTKEGTKGYHPEMRGWSSQKKQYNIIVYQYEESTLSKDKDWLWLVKCHVPSFSLGLNSYFLAQRWVSGLQWFNSRFSHFEIHSSPKNAVRIRENSLKNNSAK